MQNFSEKCEVAISEKEGRHLIAGIEISPGDVILDEKPLFITPHWDCEQMMCSNCFRRSFVICKKCQVFPLCLDCTTHNEYDCDFFATCARHISKNILVKNYAIFAVLKLILLIENPKTFPDVDAIFRQKCDLNRYRDSEMWNEQASNVVRPILKSGIPDALKTVKVDAELIHKLCILIDSNCFEVINKNGDSLKGFYIFGSKFPHNCVPNTAIAIDENFNMHIYATVIIRSGESIFNSYANPLMGTSQRQHHLSVTKNIDCTCTRCMDPTELGSYMSSLKCQVCSDGFIVCDNKEHSNWICEKCGSVTDPVEVHKLLAEVGENMVAANGDLDVYESLLSNYAPRFHKNHFLIIDIKQNIATILRAILSSSMCAPNKQILERRVQLCEEILPVVRQVLPGISKLYGIALYEYLFPFLELANFQLMDGIELETYLKKQDAAKVIAGKAMEMLVFEPSNSPEGKLVNIISNKLKHIEKNLEKTTKCHK